MSRDDVLSLDSLRREDAAELRAALTGIATYVATTRRHADEIAPTVPDLLDVLRIVETHARAVLGPGMLPRQAPAVPAPPSRGVTRIHVEQRQPLEVLTVARCAQLLLHPPGHVGRMRLDELLALVPDIGRDGADELVMAFRMAGSRAVSTVPPAERAALAAQIRAKARA